MTDNSTPNPAQAAAEYFAAGWGGVLPLPAGAKYPPPEGLTGYGGRDLEPAEYAAQRWENVGLRMPGDVLGIDVDAYHGGRATLEALTLELGPLPRTWASHSGRGDGSMIAVFRVPVGVAWRTSLPGVEIIQRAHRYAVVWPSVHPEGRRYQWYDPHTRGDADSIPRVDELPPLPPAWVAHLRREVDPGVREFSASVDSAGVAEFLGRYTEGDAPGYGRVIAQHFLEQTARGHSRHDSMIHCLLWAMEHARAGVLDAGAAVDELGDLWQRKVAEDRRRAELSNPRRLTEFAAMLAYAIERALAKNDTELAKMREAVLGVPVRVPQLGALRKAAARAHRGDVLERIDTELEGDVAAELELEPAPSLWMDWGEFWAEDDDGPRWLVDGLWPHGLAVALYADAKAGKSDLALWVAANLALGRDPWTLAERDPLTVAYLDYEMTAPQLRERLDRFGIGPSPLLETGLRYTRTAAAMLDALDTPAGGRALCAELAEVGADALVLDTFGRTLEGEEDAADTIHRFYRHTGGPLKAAGVGVLRIDHVGKDSSKGARGSSAKRADVDVIWELTRRTSGPAGAVLHCRGSRVGWVDDRLELERLTDDDGLVRYAAPVRFEGTPPGVKAKALELDALGVPLDAGRPAAKAALAAAELRPGASDVLEAALKYRRTEAARIARKAAIVVPAGSSPKTDPKPGSGQRSGSATGEPQES